MVHVLLNPGLEKFELPHARGQGGGPEEQPHVHGAVAAWAQEGWDEPLHVQGQEGRWCGDTPRAT